MNEKVKGEILEVLSNEEKDSATNATIPPSPYKVKISKPSSDDKYTTLAEIKDAYDDQFVAEFIHEHREFKFLCNRVPLFDILPDALDRDLEERTMRILYEEAIEVVLGTVVMPEDEQLTYEDISNNLPVPLVLRMKNEILNEISPGFGFGVVDEEDETENEINSESEVNE